MVGLAVPSMGDLLLGQASAGSLVAPGGSCLKSCLVARPGIALGWG